MLKQLKRNAVVAWSPSTDYPNYLALGTAAGTVGDFGTSTEVEIASLTTADAQDIFMPILGTAESAEKLHAIKWGKGIAGGPYEHGIIAGALANGSVSIWNPSVMMGHRFVPSSISLSSITLHLC
jgi:protein transport protein SEC31